MYLFFYYCVIFVTNMIKKLKILALCLCIYSGLLGQNKFNVGFGAGHQYGVLGIRGGYYLKRLEYSVNLGLIGFTDKSGGDISRFKLMNYCIGTGISYRITKETFHTPGYLTYNLGILLIKDFDAYDNYTIIPKSVHTLTINYHVSYREKFLIRIGLGAAYVPSTISNKKILPSFALGVAFPL